MRPADVEPAITPGARLARAAEAAVLAGLGGLAARTFIAVLLDLGEDQRRTGLIVGWLFLLVPGAVDTMISAAAQLVGAGAADPVLTDPEVLKGLALGVGAAVGLLNGAWRTYDFARAGAPQFLADVTWGLAGSLGGCLLGLANIAVGARPGPAEPDRARSGANRHPRGWHVPGHPSYAFTLGFTMSNLTSTPGGAVHRHERIHVLQSRVFGPLYPVSYLTWMAVMAIAAVPVALVRRQKIGPLVEAWAYLSNPWEAWAYHVQSTVGRKPRADVRAALSGGLALPERVVAVLAVPWAALVLGGLAAAVV